MLTDLETGMATEFFRSFKAHITIRVEESCRKAL
jgi:hypothetical protein